MGFNCLIVKNHSADLLFPAVHIHMKLAMCEAKHSTDDLCCL